MDVRLPDGTIVRNVPDGMTKADLMSRMAANGYDISKLQPPKETVPVEDPGVLGSALIGAGRATDQIVKGVKQLYNRVTGDTAAQNALAAEVAADDKAYAPLQALHPTATMLGEQAPGIVALGGGSGAMNMLARGALSGAAPEVLKYGTDQQRLTRGLAGGVGGALGAGAGLAAARALRPVAAGIQASPEALSAAERIGYQPTPAQMTQNKALANVENYLARSPGSSGAMKSVSDAQQSALNTAAARSMGETARDLSESTFANAQSRIGGEFNRLQGLTSPVLGGDFLNSLATVDAQNLAKGPFKEGAVSSLVDKGLDLAAQGKLSGEAYKQIRSQLGSEAQKAFKAGDSDVGQAYKTVQSALDDAANKSLSGADQEAWKAAREQWRAFKTLTKGNVAEAGNVSPARVAAQLRREGPGLRTGKAQGDLADIARIGEQFKAVENGNSGNLTANMLYGNPLTGVPMMAGNKAASALYLSPLGRRYLTEGLVPIGASSRNALARGGAFVGAPSALNLLGVE